jgi:hypothetical protein
MEDTMIHDLGEATVRWERSRMGQELLNTWHAHIQDPAQSVMFAYVSTDIHGRWYASVHPKGRDGKPSWHALYPTPEKAVNQIERWARWNWRSVPLWRDPCTWAVRSPSCR